MIRIAAVPLWTLSLALALAGCGTTTERRHSEEEPPAQIYTDLGVGYMREGRLDVALQEFERALEVDPHYPPAHNGIAVLYARLGEDDKADYHFRKAVKARGRHPPAYNNYGTFLCRKGRYREADKYFLAAVADPLYQKWVAYTNAGSCALRIPDAEKAESYFRRALEANPEFAPALEQMLRISYDKGAHLSARAYLQRYLEVANHTAATLWYGLLTEKALGDHDAVASYAMLLESRFPDSEQAGWLLEMRADGQSTGR